MNSPDILNCAITVTLVAAGTGLAGLSTTLSNRRKVLQEQNTGRLHSHLTSTLPTLAAQVDSIVPKVSAYADANWIHQNLVPLQIAIARTAYFAFFGVVLIAHAFALRSADEPGYSGVAFRLEVTALAFATINVMFIVKAVSWQNTFAAWREIVYPHNP